MKTVLVAVVGSLVVLTRGQAVAQDEVVGTEQAYSAAQIAIAERDCGRAVSHLRHVVAAEPDRWEAHRDAANCFMKLDAPDEALVSAREWQRVRPTDEGAAAAIAAAETRARQVAEQREVRQRERDAANRRAPERPPLADLARERSRPRSSGETRVYVLNGIGEPARESAPAVPYDAPVFLLDTMRQRAEEVLRPAMASVASEAQQLALAQASYNSACAGQTTTKMVDGVRAGQSVKLRETSRDRARGPEISVQEWIEHWQSTETTANAETVDCRAMEASVEMLASRIRAAMAGTDALLPSSTVYPGIRDEVYWRLRAELW